MSGSQRRSWLRRLALILVAVTAAAMRLGYVAEVHDQPSYRVPQVDAADYQAKALQVMRGEGLGPQVYYKAPAYAYLVGQIYRLTGPRLEAIYVLQMLGGVVVALLTAFLGMRWFGVAVGMLAGMLVALYPGIIYYENQLLIEPSALALAMLAITLVAVGRRRVSFLAAGVLMGIALQLRPLNAVLLLTLLGWIALRTATWTERFLRSVLFVAPVLFLLLPTARHNRLASGHLIPISVNGGINFYIGNNLDYDDTVSIRPGLRWEELTKRFGHMDDPYRWERGFYEAAWRSMQQRPWAHLALFGKKALLLWNGREIDRNQDSSVLRQASWVLRAGLPWAVLALGGLVGVGLIRRVRGPKLPLLALLFLQALAIVGFFVTSRYRLSLVPWLALATALAAREIGLALWRRNRGQLILPAVILAVACLIVLPDWTGLKRNPFGRPDFDRAMVLARLGDRQGALDSYNQALKHSPDDPDVVYRRGEHLELMGRRQEAIGAYERAAELAPKSYKPSLSLGAAFLLENDLEAAWKALSEAEARGDPSGKALYDLGLVRERQGRLEEAGQLFEQSLQRPDRPEDMALRHLGLARCQVQLGRPEVAEVHFRAAGEILKDPDAVELERAEAWLRAGEPLRTLTLLQGMKGLDDNARGQFIRARALQTLGRFDAASQAARRAAELDPASESYRRFREEFEASP